MKISNLFASHLFSNCLPSLEQSTKNLEGARLNHLVDVHDGVTLIAIQKTTSAETFDAHLYLKAGSGYESKELAGISHFLEHCVFLGTQTFPKRLEVELNLLSFGGNYNAYTSVDHTEYALSGGLKNLKAGVASLYDLSLGATLKDEVEIAKEKRVVISELEQDLMGNGQWTDQVQVAYMELFAGTVLEQSVLGTKKSLKEIGVQELKTYHEALYRKDRACLCVVSQLPPERTLEMLKEVPIPGESKCTDIISPRVVPNLKEHSLAKVKCLETNAYTWDLDFFFPFPSPKDAKECVALRLLSLVFCHSELSFLFGEARRKGLVYTAYGMHLCYLNEYVYRVATNLAPAKADKFWKLFQKQIKKLNDEGIDPKFFAFCKEHFNYSRQVILEHPGHYMHRLVDVKFLKGAFMLPEEEVAVLETVSVEDVLAVMRKIFSGNRRTVTIKGPEANKRLENSLNRKGDFMEPFF